MVSNPPLYTPSLQLPLHDQASWHQYTYVSRDEGEICPGLCTQQRIAFQEDQSSGKYPTYVCVSRGKVVHVEFTYEGLLLGAQTIAILSASII